MDHGVLDTLGTLPMLEEEVTLSYVDSLWEEPVESRSRVDRSPEDVRRCPLKEDKPFISQLPLLPPPPPPDDRLVVSAAEPLLLVCLACGWERGAEELLKEYFQEGMVLACLLGLITVSLFPDEDPSFGPGFGLGV